METNDKITGAMELIDRGWSIIPIRPDTKRPAVQWKEFQNRQCTEDEASLWWSSNEYDIAIVTGALSGIVVVDCDNEEALHAAFDAGMRSPVRVKTKRGYHLYFAHPRDGVRRGPRAGVNSRGADWPRINGLDFRGDGSYALVPPSNGYTWHIAHAHDLDDCPVWLDWRPSSSPTLSGGDFDFAERDLSAVVPLSADISEWDRTAKYCQDHFGGKRIPSGESNGRNERVMRYASETILDGYFGAELRVKCRAFMSEFFDDHLPEAEFEATIASMEQSERRNHPDRFDESGQYIYAHPDRPDIVRNQRERRLITMGDISTLEAAASSTEYLIEPWLQSASITQVHGYAGHGKSLFVQHCMAALASGRRYIGPFEVKGPARVLYLDFEMGRSTIATRLRDMREIHGETGDRLNIWAPFVDENEMTFNTKAGLEELQGWIEFSKPDVVVVDTIRTAWPGLQENSADEWGKINSLAVKLRNSGIAVVLVHHSNKPSGENGNGFGREAGSTNQLTTLETQIRITQVYDVKEDAKTNAALFDGDYDRPVWPILMERLPSDWRLTLCMEVRYGKVREWTDLHDRVQWIAFGESLLGDDRCIVSSKSTKQKAKDLALEGLEVEDIAAKLKRPYKTIRDWLGVSLSDQSK